MGRKINTMVVECPRRKRQVEVSYTVGGSWFNREYEVLSCPAIGDWGESCYRECKLQLEWSARLGEWSSRQLLS